MATTIEAKFGTSGQSITCTITSLANAAARSSVAIDNTSNLFLDAIVQVKVKTSSSALVAPSVVNVYVYGTADGGTTYGGGEANMGTDAAVTLTSPPNIALAAVINCPAISTTYVRQFSVAAAFGGILPDHWGIVVSNSTGQTLDASVGAAIYQGVQGQTV